MDLSDGDRAVLEIISKAGNRGIKSRDLAVKHIPGGKTPMQVAQRLRSMRLVRLERAVSGDNWTTTDKGEAVL